MCVRCSPHRQQQPIQLPSTLRRIRIRRLRRCPFDCCRFVGRCAHHFRFDYSSAGRPPPIHTHTHIQPNAICIVGLDCTLHWCVCVRVWQTYKCVRAPLGSRGLCERVSELDERHRREQRVARVGGAHLHLSSSSSYVLVNREHVPTLRRRCGYATLLLYATTACSVCVR